MDNEGRTRSVLLTRTGLILFVFMVCLPFGSGWADEEQASEMQENLLLLEPAYLQEQGCWQFTFSTSYWSHKTEAEVDSPTESAMTKTNVWNFPLEIEYGLTDWLQVNVEIPLIRIDQETTENDDGTIEKSTIRQTDFGDLETGLSVNVLKEDPDNPFSPTVSIVGEIAWPTGDWEKGLGTDEVGYGIGAALSKTDEELAWHLTCMYEWSNEAKEAGESATSDHSGYEIGSAVVLGDDEQLQWICEFVAEFEEEKSAEGKTHETELYVVPGILSEITKHVECGFGIPIGLTADSYDWGALFKIQIEI